MSQAEIKGKIVLVRVDFNVPLKDEQIMDDTRIIGSLPTIKHLIQHAKKILICSHLGRPGGKVVSKYSLRVITSHLSNLLKEEITFISTWEPDKLYQLVKDATSKIILLENTRFNSGETENSPEYAELLAGLAEVFVSDAFGAVHRAHASTVGVTSYIPGYAGFLVEKEVSRITALRDHPVSPSIAIFGGAKISTKLDVLDYFIGKVDTIVLGGGMANTFLKANGKEIGKSLYEKNMLTVAQSIIKRCNESGMKLILPVDVRIAKAFDEPWLIGGKAKVSEVSSIPPESIILDIGPLTEKKIKEELMLSKSIIWNGPLGVFEKDEYSNGTLNIAKAIIDQNVPTVLGGGETAYAMNMTNSHIPDAIHISTGGGASLELMSGKELPGLLCLTGKIEA